MSTERQISRERLARHRVRCTTVIDGYRALLDAEFAAREALQGARRSTSIALPESAHEILSQPASQLQHLVPDLPASFDRMTEQQAAGWRAARRNVAAIIDNLVAVERTLQLTREAKEAVQPRYRALLSYSTRLEKFAQEHSF